MAAIGAVIIFNELADDGQHLQHPALVTRVNPDGSVNALVFKDDGSQLRVRNVAMAPAVPSGGFVAKGAVSVAGAIARPADEIAADGISAAQGQAA